MLSGKCFTRWLLPAAALCIAQCSFALDNVSLQLNWTHGFQFAGYYAAKELGYYDEAGLNVNLEEAAPNSDASPNVIAGKSQFGVGTSSLLLLRAAGKPVVALAAIFQHSPNVIYTSQDIKNIHALPGKKIFVESQSDELIAYLKKEGIAADQIQRLPQSFDPQDLISGKADAISGHLYNKPYAFDLAHFAYRTFTPRMAGIDFYGDNLFTSEQELSAHPDRVRAFLLASLRGWRYAQEHRDEIIELILKKYSTHYSREYLEYEAEQTMLLLQPDMIDIGYSTPMRWQRIANVYADAGMLPRNFALDGFIYAPNQNFKSDPVQEFWQSRNIILVLLLSGLIVLFVFYFQRTKAKLKRSIEELRTLNQRELTSNHVLKLLTAGATLTEALKAVIANVPVHDSSAICSIVIFNRDGTQLRINSTPIFNNDNDESNNDVHLRPRLCACAPTLHSRKRTISKNILNNSLCSECKEMAAPAEFVSCFSEPITSSIGDLIGILSIFHRYEHEPSNEDIKLINLLSHLASVVVEHIQAKQLLQQQINLLTKVSAEVPGIIFQFRQYPDGHCCFPFISEAVRKMYGLTPEALKEDATPFFAFRHPEDTERLEASVQESARTLSRWHIEYRLILPGQGTRWRLGDAMPEKLEDGSIIWHGFITDITKRKHAEERIKHMAQFDALTDLPNRALLSDRLQQALSNAKREHIHLALMFIDFDNFKPINDSLGHAIGDKLLAKASARMQRCMRESDTIARIGGDEFVVLLPNTDSDLDAKVVAEKIRQAITIPFEIDDYTLNISVSIGIAIYPEHGEDEIELSKNADLAMYYAKQAGRNISMIYHDQMQVIGQ
jgi:diguanylate cyclase (GGDEF)-like protein/PAS domain S-box-containing protein